MKIAREFSLLLGQKIVFEELEEEEKNQKKMEKMKFNDVYNRDNTSDDLNINSDNANDIDNNNSDKNINNATKTTTNNNITDDYDYDSSDSEIQAYNIPPEDNINKNTNNPDITNNTNNTEYTNQSAELGQIKLTNYLRTCLEMFLVLESDKDAHSKHLAALISIPKIVLTNPADAGKYFLLFFILFQLI